VLGDQIFSTQGSAAPKPLNLILFPYNSVTALSILASIESSDKDILIHCFAIQKRKYVQELESKMTVMPLTRGQSFCRNFKCCVDNSISRGLLLRLEL
jgi:hypothetical protein